MRRKTVELPCGQYNTPVGNLIINKDNNDNVYLEFLSQELAAKVVRWKFEGDRFRQFEIETGQMKDQDSEFGSVMTCCHIDLNYRGTVYKTFELDGKMEVYCCPECDKRGLDSSDPVTVIDRALWKEILPELHCVEANEQVPD